ncbi:MAG: hypothetical protein PHE55_20325 [Methylococcaceae bacterium]|nr:hypothetical protein [Methylococcaceae bacterium]
MHTIHFDPNTEQELARLAALAGKNSEQFIQDVVRDYLEDQADIREAEAALARIERGEETPIPWKAIKAEHGL